MDRVNGANTVDIGGGRRGFRSQNAAAGIAGTEVTSKFMNDVQEEICKVISEAGIELDPENQQQLYEALLAISAPGYGNRSPWLPVISMTVIAPPNDAETGDTYCIPAGATGVWAGKSQDIAEWTGSTWRIFTPKDGHGIGLPSGTVFIRINGVYVEWLASREWVASRKTPIGQLNSLPWVTVKSITLATPPATPAEGDIYVIAPAATGAWAGKAGQVAEWASAGWKFIVPKDGHGVSLPDGRVFERVAGTYVEKLAIDAQSGKWNFAVAAGSANALTISLDPVLSVYTAGTVISVKVAATNTGPATIKIDALAAIPIVHDDGSTLNAGDLPAGSIVTLVCDGSRFICANAQRGRLLGVQSFRGIGTFTYTPTPGTSSVVVEVQGGGGAGAGSKATGSNLVGVGSAGAAGAYASSRITSGFSGVTITVGAGGTPTTGENGGNGGASSFGSFLSAGGGGGGGSFGPTTAPIITGGSSIPSATGGNIVNVGGNTGGLSSALTSSGTATGGAGGSSRFGGGGSAVAGNVNGIAATGAGSGGGGTANSQSTGATIGGFGSAGIVIVWEYA